MKFVRYEDFSKIPNLLTVEVACQIYESIFSLKEDIELAKLLEELINLAVDYANIRSRWLTMSAQQTVQMNEIRSQYHDFFIASINNLSRYMYLHGYENTWANLLGDDRKRIGDFACYITYIQAINAR